MDLEQVPVTIIEWYRRVTLGADIMFFNKIPFFVTISRAIKFGTLDLLKNRKIPTILEAVRHVYRTYKQRGFQIDVILMDGEFKTMRGELSEMKIMLNDVSNAEHVPMAERKIRTVKEKVRSIYNMLPFRKIPAMMVVQMV